MDIRITRARRIYADGKHNAFTGIAAGFGKTYISFRSAKSHMAPSGSIRIIASEDREDWQTAAEVCRPDADLRDPKAIFFAGKLMIYYSQRPHNLPREMRMLETTNGVDFNEPIELRGLPSGQWLWHMRECDGRLYGTAYCSRNGQYAVALYDSEDGLNWKHVSDFPVPGNETFLDFDENGRLWALIRDDHRGFVPTLCVAEPPYSRFQFVTRLPMKLQGPMLKRLAGGCVLVCRQWDPPGWRNLRTDVFWMDDGDDPRRIATLPSGGDTSYAAWLDLSRGRAVISYYSSHEHMMAEAHGEEAKESEDQPQSDRQMASDIFLADVSYASFHAAE